MERKTLSTWYTAPDDTAGREAFGLLAAAESALWRMIFGTFHLLTEGIPHWLARQFRTVIATINRAARFIARLGVRLVRLSVPATILLLLIMVPYWTLPEMLCGTWLVFVVSGSIYGLLRWRCGMFEKARQKQAAA